MQQISSTLIVSFKRFLRVAQLIQNFKDKILVYRPLYNWRNVIYQIRRIILFDRIYSQISIPFLIDF